MENPYFLFFVKFADIIFIFAWRHTINLFKSPIKGSLAGETGSAANVCNAVIGCPHETCRIFCSEQRQIVSKTNFYTV